MAHEQQNSGLNSLDLVTETIVSEGTALEVGGNWGGSEALFTDAINKSESGLIQFYNKRGLTFRMRGNFEAADQDFTQALKLSRRTRNIDGEFNSLSGLMDSARKSKRIALAVDYEEYAKQVLSITPEDHPCIGKVNILTNFGLLEHDTGEDDLALESYGAAERVCRQLIMQDPTDIDFQNRLARIFTVRPEAYKALNKYEEAYNDQIIALDLNTKLGEVRGLGNSTYSLGEIAEKINKPDSAKEWYKKTLEASQKIVDGKTEVIDPEINKMADDALLRLSSI